MKIITLVAVAALAATPALAASGKKKPHRHHHHQRTQLYVTQDHPGYWRNSHNQYRSMDVYSYDGRLIGRDPARRGLVLPLRPLSETHSARLAPGVLLCSQPQN